ncbi:MAG: bifunctional riboflavin kinase/FAD synthetase [Gammaproteobacteria bacterium]
MELIRRFASCTALTGGSVVTIGNYDGVHLGHRALLDNVTAQSKQLNLPSCVMSFEPMPSEFFGAAKSPGRLSTWRERYLQLKAAGIDVLFLTPFSQAIANLTPEQFVRDVLVNKLHVKLLYVGDDFRFGKGRAGGVDELRDMGERYDFSLAQLPSQCVGGERVSSSLIREALLDGRLERAAKLLGRPYSMSGRVIRGQQLGRTLGFPTANIHPRRNSLPMSGIFAIRVTGAGLRDAPAVANLGFRPTVGGGDALLEAHVFDFDGDLYGHRLQVDFVAKLRDEEHFESLDEMVVQMDVDAAEARTILDARKS